MKIKLNHFHDKEVGIVSALEAIAGQEGNDGEDYDLMVKAAQYIRTLEQVLKPTEEMVQKGAYILSECLNDNAPIGQKMYESPARLAYITMVEVATKGK